MPFYFKCQKSIHITNRLYVCWRKRYWKLEAFDDILITINGLRHDSGFEKDGYARFLITWMVILICLLVSNRLPVGLLGAVTLLALIAVGAIGAEQAFAYITNENNILIMSVFVISTAMFKSGLCDVFGLPLRRAAH